MKLYINCVYVANLPMLLSLVVLVLMPPVAKGDQQDPIPSKILKSKGMIQLEDENLYRLVEGVKLSPRLKPGAGVSGLRLWCELVIRSALPKSQVSSYFTVGLYQSLDDETGRIVYVSIRETKSLDEGLKEMNFGLFDLPELLDKLSSKAAEEIFRKYGPSAIKNLRFMDNYTFKLSWINDELHSRIEIMAKVPVAIPDDFFRNIEWGEVNVLKADSGKPPWRLGLLPAHKFRLFKSEGKGEEFRIIYFGEFDSAEIWNEVVRRMVVESPELREVYAGLLEGNLDVDLKVVISTLALNKSAVERNSIVSTIENTSNVPKGILLWGTPFDPIVAGRAFAVNDVDESDTLELLDEDFKVKRTTPAETDCVILLPGESLSSVVDLGKFFPLKPETAYEVKHDFDLQSFDVNQGKVEITRGERVKVSGRWVPLKKLENK